jgi:hypothetical protein
VNEQRPERELPHAIYNAMQELRLRAELTHNLTACRTRSSLKHALEVPAENLLLTIRTVKEREKPFHKRRVGVQQAVQKSRGHRRQKRRSIPAVPIIELAIWKLLLVCQRPLSKLLQMPRGGRRAVSRVLRRKEIDQFRKFIRN